MNIYVINLKESIDRRKSIEQQFKTLGLRGQIVDAVNGWALKDEELPGKVDMNEVNKHPDWLTKGAIGCGLSHLSIYKMIAASDSEWNLILEDDVILSKDLKGILDNFERNQANYRDHLNLLYTTSRAAYGPVVLSAKPLENIGRYTMRQVLNSVPGAAGAYVIHRDVAKRLLEANTPVKVAPDTWHYFLEKGIYSQINCVYPFAAKPGFFESMIGYVKHGSIIYRLKRFVSKHKIPPFYNLLKWNRERIWKKITRIKFQ